jgi:hypothetical protein
MFKRRLPTREREEGALSARTLIGLIAGGQEKEEEAEFCKLFIAGSKPKSHHLLSIKETYDKRVGHAFRRKLICEKSWQGELI